MADPTTPPASTITLRRGDEEVTVPESARLDLEKIGFAAPPPPDTSLGADLLGGVEALGRGATLGLSSVASDTLAGFAGSLAGPDVARTSERGFDAPVDERSDFRRAYEQNAAERAARKESLGGYATAAEIAGGLVPVLLSGGAAGAGMAARAIAASPAALAERAGVAAASKLLGAEAVTVGARAAQLAVQAGVEGAIGGGAMAASESIPTALEDPSAAAQEVLLETGLGAGAGALLGGALGGAIGAAGGLVEGVLRRADPGFQKKILDSTAPHSIPEPNVALTLDAAEKANAARPLTADLAPDPRVRGKARTALDGYQALTGGLDDAVEEGTRRGQAALDQFEDLRQRFDGIAGVAAKNRVNEVSLSEGFANQLTDALDEVDVEDLARLRTSAESARKAHLDLDGAVDEKTTALALHREAEAAARAKLDDLLAPRLADVDPAKAAAVEAARATRDTTERAFQAYRARAAGEIDAKALSALEKEAAKAKRAFEASERAAKPGRLRPDGAALRTARESLGEASRARKALEKDLADTTRGVLSLGEEAMAAEAALAARSAPRRLTKIEVASRQMFDGLLGAVDEQLAAVGGREADVVLNFRRQIASHREKALQAMRAGDYGTGYSLIDQGLKHAIADVVESTKSTAVREFAKAVYSVPRSFVENADVWGVDIAGRNIAANPAWSAALAARQDAGFKSLYAQGGEANVDGWGARKVANSASINGLMRSAGDAATATQEAGARQALRAQIADFSARSKAWGGPASQEMAELAARAQTQFEDLLDHAARTRFDALSAKSTLDSLRSGAGGLLVATGAGAALGMGGAAVAAVPLIAGKWFLGTVAKGKGDLGARIVRGLANGVLKAGHVAAPVVRSSIRTAAGALGERERAENEETLAEARALTDPASPTLGKLAAHSEQLNAVSPGLGDAVFEQRLREANFLVSKLPVAPSPAVFSPPPKQTDAAARQFDRLIGAIRRPDQTFEKIFTGVATGEEMDAMRQVYPAVYQKMVDTIMHAVSTAPERVKSTRTRMYLARVTQQPLTPALMRLSSSQARARAATQSAEAAGGIVGEGANGADGVTPTARSEPMNPDSAQIYGNRSDVITSKLG